MFTILNWKRIPGFKSFFFQLPIKVFTFRFTDCKVLLGNQQLLMQLINEGELDIEDLDSYSSKELTTFLSRIGVERKEIRKYVFISQFSS